MSKGFVSVILAAGEGTRMKSDQPKVLHQLAGKSMVAHILDTALSLGLDKQVLVVGFGGDEVREKVRQNPAYKSVAMVFQDRQLGSGHAVLQAVKAIGGYRGQVLLLCADVPLIKADTLKKLMTLHKKQRNAVTILTTEVDHPTGYGRIIRTANGQVLRIVEEKEATDQERIVREINSGIYCFDAPTLCRILKKIKPNNKKKEYYLTDAVEFIQKEQGKIGALICTCNQEVAGINNRQQLAAAQAYANEEKLAALMKSGVTIIDPDSTWIDPQVTIGRDTVIYPGAMIQGDTSIGKKCSIGPHSFIKDSVIRSQVEIRASFIYGAEIADRVKIGPFAHVRPGTKIATEARIGNFVEIKKSQIGKGSKVSHLTYIGDAALDSQINIGAGVITCNYDGVNKHQTIIEKGVFVGSNVNLVAPVKIGAGAVIGAGSTITEDVPAQSLAIARARQVNKANWAVLKKLKLRRKKVRLQGKI